MIFVYFVEHSVFQFSRTMIDYSRKTSGFKSRTALLLDLKGPRRPRSSIVESTSAPPFSFMERNRSNLLVAAGLAPARHEAKNPFLTPQNLLIMAIYEIPESFVEVSLTHPSLACDMLLVSLCFRDSRDLSFKLFVCLIHLLYVCKIMLQNFVSYVPLFGFD
ncbi:transmembrane protein [Arabidopsis thaliana]|jgi:hypothetical protein|uniref:Transmembrane protein n=2 Tax=Arabidopsis thaliana TaxID=3702 RepID=A0A1P8B5I4_ARATH|nr:uncharacterized protein AT4G08874 [Arabidopsis thaliana]ANM66848.1 transmembrane protein [Arabidopsis thaliana]|eukprot:NP_001328717.1 transmembrane protein [Arabidopsis thaliana]